MASGIFELAIVILIASVLGIIAKLLRQPIILAYLLTGIIIGSLGALDIVNGEIFAVFSHLGIMFLLFLVGLEINYTSVRFVGKTAIIVGLGQILFTALFGYIISTALGFPWLHALYIGVALTFSSTVIVVKMLSDRKDLNSLYGKISIGLLLTQDLVAVLILMFLAGLRSGEGIVTVETLYTVGKGILLFAITIWLGRKVLPRIFSYISHSQELLFLVSLAWLFLVVAAVNTIGFSTEVAGLIAGIALANSSEHFQIAGRIRSLRDFFILIFFVILGSSIIVSNFSGLILPIIILSLFVLIGDPLIVFVILSIMGYRRKTSFFTGVTIAQISEFSLILAAVGFGLGHIPKEVVMLITTVGVLTIGASTYMITHANSLFRILKRPLGIFERKNSSEFQIPAEGFNKSIILIGCHRTGEGIAMSLPRKDLLIVDIDPDVIYEMSKKGYECLFGDIVDLEIFEKANIEKANLIISTSQDIEDNLALLGAIKMLRRRPKTIIRAETENDTHTLYKAGADYVLLPHFTSGQYLGKTIAIDPDMKILKQLKEHDLALLHKIAK